MRKKILIADDDDQYRIPIVRMFEDAGYQVAEAESQEEVIAKAPSCDVWVIDVRLPNDVEGISAVRELVQRTMVSKYPVIFISIWPESEPPAQPELAKLRGADVPYQWVKKPLKYELLEQTVEEFLRADKIHTELEAFHKLRSQLLNEHHGRFVAVHEGQVIDVDDDEFRLATRVEALATREGAIAICRVWEDEAHENAVSPSFDSPVPEEF